jgi:hypothetical protein
VAVRVTVYSEQLRKEAMENSLPGRKDVAEQVVDRFRSTAPIKSGEYRSGASVTVDGSRVFVENSDPEAFYKEYGTSKTRAHSAMVNAARQFGKYTGFQPRGRR